jgi:hypothetical protein
MTCCCILPGSKQVQINDALLSYNYAHYLFYRSGAATARQILNEKDGRPHVAVSLILDPDQLADVAATMPQVKTQKFEP